MTHFISSAAVENVDTKQMARAFAKYTKTTCRNCYTASQRGMSDKAIGAQLGLTTLQAKAAILAYESYVAKTGGKSLPGDKTVSLKDCNAISLAAAKVHKFAQIEEGAFLPRRMQPDQRFAVLFSLYLQSLASVDEEIPNLGNIYLTGHTDLSAYTARYMAKPMSVAAMFVYFRTKPNLIECGFAWAYENLESDDAAAKSIAKRIMRQYDAVYN